MEPEEAALHGQRLSRQPVSHAAAHALRRDVEMMRIVFLDRRTMSPTLQLRRPSFEHDWIEYDRTSPSEVVERLQNCDIAISNKVPIRRENIEKLSSLKMIAIPATGYDAFDVRAGFGNLHRTISGVSA
jgi:phosphoglycerate dehydrogenase-like enzyme